MVGDSAWGVGLQETQNLTESQKKEMKADLCSAMLLACFEPATARI